ncbi:enoyl-CoA hydratase [Virgibacillus necropolis]|uniref:Enoyl-CoA hydratase n=1 Tax=Virgibacillus necropolis TaxID=163877 RepID=A0A221MG63_9BACI|nr:enoyl-CoA hydratase [Virgibacillus necropolis]ASN06602.1 enoyl-CoA hydratase [Virgibacillus necropolis]
METVLYESIDQIGYIYLNRPDRYNALNKEMLHELLEVIIQVEQSDDHIVIISGKGKAFCAGGDISMMTDWKNQDFYHEVMETVEKITMKLYLMPKIVISAIKGSAAGLGLSLALVADYVVAQNDAKIGMLFLGVGLAPDGGGHFWLKERLGVHGAKQFIWSMKKVDGTTAYSMNLVDQVSDEPVLNHATSLAKSLLIQPLSSIVKTKLMYHNDNKSNLQHYLTEEKKNQWELRQTKDHQEGVSAFLEKRKPTFIGE